MCVRRSLSPEEDYSNISKKTPKKASGWPKEESVLTQPLFYFSYFFLMVERDIQKKEVKKTAVRNSNNEHFKERKVNYSTRKDARNVKNVSK